MPSIGAPTESARINLRTSQEVKALIERAGKPQASTLCGSCFARRAATF